MKPLKHLALLGLVAGLVAAPVMATTVLKMNLADMCARAHQAYRGTVIQIEEGTVSVGGGQLPTVTYTLRVDDPLVGTFDNVKGEQIATFTTLGKMAPVDAGNARRVSALPTMPSLAMGQSYLLLTTAPSSAGLSTTVGLGQGCFAVSGDATKTLTAVNPLNNVGLFDGMSGSFPASGAVDYSMLATEILDAAAGQ